MDDQSVAINGSYNEVNCDRLNKRIEVLIDELSDLLQQRVKSSPNSDELNKNIESKDDIEVKPLLARLESMANLLEREDSDLYFETLYPLILNTKLSLNSIFWINYCETKRNASELTSVNVKMNSIWETICYKIEKLIINDMIRNSFESELDFERICSHLRFLSKLKDTDSAKQMDERGSEIWKIFDVVRVCRLESQTIELYEKTFDSFLQRIIFVINFEVLLFKSGYFGSYGLTYRELVIPYLESVKTRFEAEISGLNTNVLDLISLMKCMLQFDDNLEQIRQQMPRMMESPEVEQLFEWKSFLEINININSFNKIIYKEITSDLKELQCFRTNWFVDCRPSDDHNILSCVWQVFHNFQDYQYLCASDSMSTFLSYAISANILDFFVHHFHNGKYESIEQKYTLLNSVHYVINRLQDLDISADKFVAIAETAVKDLRARHVSVLLIASNVRYSVLYLNRLWFELQIKLSNYSQRSSIFEFVLSETIHHFSGTSLTSFEMVFLMNNTIDLLLKNSYSRKELLFDIRDNIHNSVWIIFTKLILKITDNEDFIANLKTSHNLPEVVSNDFNDHWVRYIRPKLMDNSFWLSARLCVDKPYDKDLSKPIIRAFLSKNCGFSSFVLSNMDHKYENDGIVSNAKNIFELILLQNFRPNLLSSVLMKLIERESNWSEFDKSTISSSDPRVWWYRALEVVIIADIDVILLKNLKSLINDSIISSLVTEEIQELYKTNEIELTDKIESEGLDIMYALINDAIHSLSVPLVISLEAMNSSAPEYIHPIADSITLNILISLVSKRLQNCSFLESDNRTKQVLEFCQNLNIRFAESLTEDKYLLRIKRSIESRKLEKIDSLNNEELEFDIISSSIDFDNQEFEEILRRLHSLLIEYKEVIDKNVSERYDHSFDVILNDKKDFVFKYIPNPKEDYDYKQILDSIDWKSLENQIKLKFDYSSRLALIEEQRQ